MFSHLRDASIGNLSMGQFRPSHKDPSRNTAKICAASRNFVVCNFELMCLTKMCSDFF
jgi:hypothetical protein